MRIQKFVVYISYEPNGSVCFLTQSDESKHWVLIFKSEDVCLRLDATDGVDGNVKSRYGEVDFSRYENKEIFVIAHFSGYICDVDMAVKKHTMNGTKYCVEYNNCPHYVARVLVYLESNAKAAGRSFLFNIDVFNKDECKYLKTMEVLKKCNNGFRNKQNKQIAEVVYKSRVGGSIGSLGFVASVASVSLPAAGIWGSLGYTVTVPMLGAFACPAFVFGVVSIAVVGISFMEPKSISMLAESDT
jgi:hypothetical protein